MRLWIKALGNGTMRAWLEQSELEPVIITAEQARRALVAWKYLRTRMRRGEHTDLELATRFRGERTNKDAVLVFALDNGRMTYWRNGEKLKPIPLNLEAVDNLISAWDTVYRAIATA
ncbi:hypothetical protein SAMN05216174_12058 [Actinokineospora iranica]|uniref:Uncharacterized protein n=2 Tax=Actinokineospora iranica TaxID=1271860 RepID=A0A1G6Y934_9PSEU|nr:hypothetical protein SAMN05216174_12058 [Actinokineospora iranica]